MSQIRVTFQGGKTQMEAEGFQGPACKTAVMKLVEQLKAKVVAEEETADYRRDATHNEFEQA